MELVPEALHVTAAALRAPTRRFPALVERGLSAQLVMQSFVTGTSQVELDFRPGVQASRVGEPTTVPEVPTVPSGFETFTKKLEEVDIAATLQAAERAFTSVEHDSEQP